MTQIAEKQSKKITKRGGARANAGGRRSGAGRPAGVPNLLTRPLKEKAAAHADDVLAVLVEVANDKTQPAAARVAACCAVLDRGFGKPRQEVDQTLTFGVFDRASLEDRFVTKMREAHERQTKLMEDRAEILGVHS